MHVQSLNISQVLCIISLCGGGKSIQETLDACHGVTFTFRKFGNPQMPGSNYFVRILSTLNRELLKPNCSVALHRHSHAVVDILPPEADSTVPKRQELIEVKQQPPFKRGAMWELII